MVGCGAGKVRLAAAGGNNGALSLQANHRPPNLTAACRIKTTPKPPEAGRGHAQPHLTRAAAGRRPRVRRPARPPAPTAAARHAACRPGGGGGRGGVVSGVSGQRATCQKARGMVQGEVGTAGGLLVAAHDTPLPSFPALTQPHLDLARCHLGLHVLQPLLPVHKREPHVERQRVHRPPQDVTLAVRVDDDEDMPQVGRQRGHEALLALGAPDRAL